jgi:hypothetical protein
VGERKVQVLAPGLLSLSPAEDFLGPSVNRRKKDIKKFGDPRKNFLRQFYRQVGLSDGSKWLLSNPSLCWYERLNVDTSPRKEKNAKRN